MKYFRLIRIQDQYIQLGSVLAAAVYLHISDWKILLFWLLATTFNTFVAFIINELVDREDTDKYSWNKLHIAKNVTFNPKILAIIIVGFSFLGLLFSYLSRLFWWGLVMYILGVMYSLKPIRLKNRFALDVIVQMVIWVIIPFLALESLYKNIFPDISFILTMTLILFPEGFAYQLADFNADKKVGLKGTHVILGMNNSLIFGILCLALGLILFIYLKIYLIAIWLLPIVTIGIFTMFLYLVWLKEKNPDRKILSIQKYIRIIKPFSQLIIPYLIVWLFV